MVLLVILHFSVPQQLVSIIFVLPAITIRRDFSVRISLVLMIPNAYKAVAFKEYVPAVTLQVQMTSVME
jgi:hypothetical protein